MSNYYRQMVENLDNLVKSRFIEMISKEDYHQVCLGKLMIQAGNVERIDHPEKEIFVTLSSQGKGARQRKISDGKTPVQFTGYRVKTGQFIYSRIDARNGAFGIVPEELNNAVVSKDFPIFNLNNNLIRPEFLIYSLLQDSFLGQVRSSSFGATNRQRIKEEIFAKYSIKLPPIDIQNNFALFVQQVDKSKIV